MRLGKVAKAGGHGDEEEPHAAAHAADDLDYDGLRDEVEPAIRAVARDGAKAGLEQVARVAQPANPLDDPLSQANERAAAWAEERAGELVTQIDETTRERVRALVAQAEAEGWSNNDLADEIEDSDVFDADRAELVARTETAFADVQGNLLGWQASGVVQGKEWKVADANECDLCADLDGVVVGLDEDFPDDGGDGPPLHPRCRCDVLPVLADDEGEG